MPQSDIKQLQAKRVQEAQDIALRWSEIVKLRQRKERPIVVPQELHYETSVFLPSGTKLTPENEAALRVHQQRLSDEHQQKLTEAMIIHSFRVNAHRKQWWMALLAFLISILAIAYSGIDCDSLRTKEHNCIDVQLKACCITGMFFSVLGFFSPCWVSSWRMSSQTSNTVHSSGRKELNATIV